MLNPFIKLVDTSTADCGLYTLIPNPLILPYINCALPLSKYSVFPNIILFSIFAFWSLFTLPCVLKLCENVVEPVNNELPFTFKLFIVEFSDTVNPPQISNIPI